MIFILLPFALFAQNEVHLNGIVFVDGKLSNATGYFESVNSKEKINFSYVIGDFILKKLDYDLLKNLSETDSIYINLEYIPKLYGEVKSYRKKIDYPQILWGSYFVFRITNLKKNKYYFGISSPSIISPFIRKEYYMFDDMYKYK